MSYNTAVMIDLKALRENPDVFREGLGKKGYDIEKINEILALDEKARELKQKLDVHRAAKNTASEKIAKLQGANRQTAIDEMQSVGNEEKVLKEELDRIEAGVNPLLNEIPNPAHESVPKGGEENNIIEKTHGQARKFDFTPKDHVELGEHLGWINIEKASAGSGARFAYIMGDAARIEFALVRYIFDKLTDKGFTPVVPPVLVKEHAMFGTGFFPADKNEIYRVNPEEDDLYLVGTSEVSLALLHADEILNMNDLPLRYCAFSTCFRREAGSYGKDTKGIIRVHQFDKIEMFSFCHPEKSWEEHELLREIEEEIMRELELPYQVVNIAGGELGAPAAKKYDIEVWIPTQEKYRELTSTSNCTDFQARRLKIRYKTDKGNEPVHTLNGTAIAIGRTLVALMENGQQADCTIKLPDILKGYM